MAISLGTFPELKGFSTRNLKYMKVFADMCPDLRIGQQPAAQLSWFHVVVLLPKLPDAATREWYAERTIANGWSRQVLEAHQRPTPPAFKPEHAGKLNFYLAAVDRQVKAPDDQPTIGLLLCKTKNRLVAEYALSGLTQPMGVAEYQLVRALPEPLDTKLPTIEQLEAELNVGEAESEG